ncbi:MAG: cysteine hydrolase family protein [Candidatus Asgardarchaeia archaeon]
MSSNLCLIIIDMQNDFVEPDAPTGCEGALEIVENVKALLKLVHEKGIPVIYTQELHRPDGSDFGIELEKEPRHCIEGSRGAEIVEELKPNLKDYLITKRRYSTFHGTDLEILLKGLHTDTLIIAGVATNVCVRATCQDAKQLNYHVIVPEECVAGTTVEAHKANLKDIQDFYGEVMPLKEVIKIIERNVKG